MRCKQLVLRLTTLAALLLGPSALLAQGTVSGRVIDSTANAPINAVSVQVVNSSLGTRTDAEGRYVIHGVPAGAATVRAIRVGYRARSQVVTVAAGQTSTLDFGMAPAALQLQEVVTTATGSSRKVELGNSITSINNVAQKVEQAPVTNLSDLLVGKAPGVSVLQGSMTGSTPVIKIRGLNSLSLNNDPIYVIDGVRMNTGNFSVGYTGTHVSYLASLDPNEIQSVEIVKGPSAATLYGTDAANGVVVITTKRGQTGPPKWTWYAETGAVDDRNDYPAQYATFGHNPTTGGLQRCVLVTISQGTCVADSVTSFNALRNSATTPLTLGNRKQLGMNVSGGTSALRYFVSGDAQNEVGPFQLPGFARTTLDSMGGRVRDEWVHPEAFQSENFRANLSASPNEHFDLNVNSGYSNTNQRLPQTDNNIYSVYYSAFNGPGFNFKSTAPASSGLAYSGVGSLGESLNGYGKYSPAQIFQYVPQVGTQRFIGSSDATWRPLSWFQALGTVGLDLAGRNDQRICRYGACPASGTLRQGLVYDRQTNDRNFSGKLNGTASWHATSWSLLKTTLGADYNNLEEDYVSANGSLLPPGGQNVNQAAIKDASSQLQTVNKTLGLYFQEELALRDRLFLTGAVRTDQNSAFGTQFQRVYYPKASLSWLLSNESFFPHPSFLNEFRLRAAYGASGVQPGATTALQTFRSLAANLAVNSSGSATGTDTPGLAPDSLGNANLRPERSSEFEGGFDAQLFSNRIGLEFTFYNKKTQDALIAQPIAASAAASALTVVRNLGSVQNHGIEVQLNTRLVDTRLIAWDLTVGGSHNTNKIVSLGRDVNGKPNPTIGTGAYRDSLGLPANGAFARAFTYTDANGDGVITPDEVAVSNTYSYLGYSSPRDIVSVQNGFDLFDRRVHVQALLDYRGGSVLYNQSTSFYCLNTKTCADENIKSTSLYNQARLIAYSYGDPKTGVKTAAGYFDNGQFWKFRELSVSVTLPNAFARSLRATDATILLAGRNLHTWTKYTGVDPEANYGVGDVQTDFSTTAPRTYYIARVNLHY